MRRRRPSVRIPPAIVRRMRKCRFLDLLFSLLWKVCSPAPSGERATCSDRVRSIRLMLLLENACLSLAISLYVFGSSELLFFWPGLPYAQ